jgi:hypothetical protein
MVCGSPATVIEAIAEIDKIGVGGLILVFRLGPMPYEVAENSIQAVHEQGGAAIPGQRRSLSKSAAGPLFRTLTGRE